MKKTLLAVAIPALLASGAASATTIYDNNGTKVDLTGELRINLEYSDTRKQPDENKIKLRDSDSRFGFNVYHDLSNGLVGLLGVEFGENTQSTENNFQLKNRLGYVGLSAKNVGEMTFGRILAPFDDVPVSDYTYVYGGVLNFDTTHSAFGRTDLDNNFIGRTSNSVKLKSDSFDGFSFAGSYTLQGEDAWKGTEPGTPSRATSIDNAYTLAAFYKNVDAGIRFNLGYGRAETSSDSSIVANNAKITDSIVGLGAEYNIQNRVYIAVDLGQVNVKNRQPNQDYKANLYGLALKYQWSREGDVYFGGYLKDGKKDAKDWDNKLLVVGSVYKFTEQVLPYIEYAHGKDKLAEVSSTDNKVAVGMRVYF